MDGSNTAVMPVFEKICQETGALLVTSAPEQIRNVVLSPAGEVFDYKDLKELHLSLTGVYQMNNAAVVIETLRVLEQKGYRIGEAALRKGLSEVYWPDALSACMSSRPFWWMAPITRTASGHCWKACAVIFRIKKSVFCWAFFPQRMSAQCCS